MSTEDNKALYRRFVAEVLNGGQLDRMGEFLAPDVIEHPLGAAGLEAARQFTAAFRAAVPDLRLTIEDLVAEGDRVVARVTSAGTQRGAFMGIPATGRSFRIEEFDMWRLAGGKCAEHWAQGDFRGLLEQLGLAPPPGQAPA